MKMFKNKATMLLAGLAALMLSMAAQAGTITVTGIDMKYSPARQGNLNVTPRYKDAVTGTILAGEIRLTTNKGPIDAFCIDVTSYLKKGDFNEVADAPAPNGLDFDLIGKLYDHYYAGATNAARSAAFQLALWAIVNGSSTSLSSNFGTGFDGHTYVKDAANAWLASLEGKSPLNHYQFTVLEPVLGGNVTSNQRLLTITPVPEPGTLALLGLGLLGAGAIRRRRS